MAGITQNGCVVAKFNGSMQDDNIPRLGVASFSIKSRIAFTFYLGASGNSIHVKSKVPFTPSGSSTKETEHTITSGDTLYATVALADIPSDAYCEDIVEFDNFYNCNVFCIIRSTFLYRTCIGESDPQQNLMSLWKYAPLELASLSKEDVVAGVDIADSVYYINTESDKYNGTPMDASKILAMPNIEVLTGMSENGTSALVIDLDNDYVNSNVLYLGAVFVSQGDNSNITHLPYNLRYCYAQGLKGAIEDYVTMAISKGRVTGTLVLASPAYAGSITFGGNLVKDLVDGGQIPTWGGDSSQTVISFAWDDQGNITWLSTSPGADYPNKIPAGSAYYAKKHSNQ